MLESDLETKPTTIITSIQQETRSFTVTGPCRVTVSRNGLGFYSFFIDKGGSLIDLLKSGNYISASYSNEELSITNTNINGFFIAIEQL